MNTTIPMRQTVYAFFLIFSLILSACNDDEVPTRSVKVSIRFRGINDTVPAFNIIAFSLRESSPNSNQSINTIYTSTTGTLNFTEELKTTDEYRYYLIPVGNTFDNYHDAGDMVFDINKNGTDTTVWMERSGRVNILLKNIKPVNSKDKLEISQVTNGRLSLPEYDRNYSNSGYYVFNGTNVNQVADFKVSPNQSFIFEYYVTKDSLGVPFRKRYFMQFPMHKGRNPDLEILY